MISQVVQPLSLVILTLFTLPLEQAFSQVASESKIPFYIGSYTNGSSQGVYRSELNLETGELDRPKLVAEIVNPTFLAIHPEQDVLYAVSEIAARGDHPQQVFAYRIAEDGGLKELNHLPAGGDGPCHISTDPQGEFAFVANYGSGTISAYRLAEDGSLAEMTSNIQHQGSGANPRRQEKPHAHCIVPDPSGKFALAVDLGTDEVRVYRLDRSRGALQDTGRPLRTAPGDGPRHLTFHPNDRHAFVIHELSSRLSSLAWDAEGAELTELATVSTLPDDYQGEGNSTAEVLVHPNGRVVYGSNRGHDSIAVFAFDEKSGSLTPTQHISTGGQTPRNFRLDPSGRYLLAENQGSDSIHVFEVSADDGTLTPTGHSITAGSACCIRFLDR